VPSTPEFRCPGFTGDEVYGADPGLREDLETRGASYVRTIGRDRRVATPTGALRAEAVAGLPTHVWQRLSACAGAKGHRYHDWARIDIDTNQPAGHRWLLIHRNRTAGELAYYRCYAPHPVPLRILVRVAGKRWTVEESFQAGKGLSGLDQHQVRRWTSWHRWTILAMLAHPFLAAVAVTERAQDPKITQWIASTCNEIRHLSASLISHPVRDIAQRLRRPRRRRRHQHRAKESHYHRQSTYEP
jgi:SRSO17 transposase